jgi:hypothetical protein
VKNKKNDQENKDFFGDKWKLAPGGRKSIDKCQTRVWELYKELNGYASLFRNMGNCELDCDELYGISLSLQRMGKRLGKISDKLSGAIVKEDTSDTI